MIRRPFVRPLLASVALVAAIGLAGCQTDGGTSNTKAMQPLSPRMVADIEAKGMNKESPILIRLFKEESELEVWKQDRNGRYALLKTYPICRWSGELGPKLKEGDRQAPEGFYTITPAQMNPNSQFHLSFDLGFPNAFDRAHGRTGSHLMVHGDCSSAGCYSMTDEQISEIYALGREAFFGGQRAFQVQAYPFRMTPENMARHRNNPHMAFWRTLKEGNDHFKVTLQEPVINVCDRRYVFNAQDPNNPSRPLAFNASGPCPEFEVPQHIASALQDKQRRDASRLATLIKQGTPQAPVRTYTDGGMHPVFTAAVERQRAGGFSLASTPGTVPAHVQPPRRQPGAPSAPARVAAAPASEAHGVMTYAQTNDGVAGTNDAPNIFGNMFGSRSSSDTASSGGNALTRAASWMGLRGSTTQAEAPPAPAARPSRASQNRATPTRTPTPRPQQTASAGASEPMRESQGNPWPEPAPVATATRPATTMPEGQRATAPTTALAGAAPTVPAGSFENRWIGFR